MWRPEVSVRCFPLSTSTLFWGSSLSRNLELIHLATLAAVSSEELLPLPSPPQCWPPAVLDFITWVLEIRIHVPCACVTSALPPQSCPQPQEEP